MSNFTRKLDRANMLDRMADQLRAAEATEARAVFMAAIYEAVFGALELEFVKAVQEAIKNEQPKTKGDFFNMVYNAASTLHMEREVARATPVTAPLILSDTHAQLLGDAAQESTPSSEPSAE